MKQVYMTPYSKEEKQKEDIETTTKQPKIINITIEEEDKEHMEVDHVEETSQGKKEEVFKEKETNREIDDTQLWEMEIQMDVEREHVRDKNIEQRKEALQSTQP